MNTNQKKKQEELTKQTASGSSSLTGGGSYVESEAVRLANEKLNSLQKPGEFQSPWQNSLNEIIGKIQNREKFSYDLNGDALYQQYKDQYVNQGQMAMMDTMGQAAALTGGYGNSYAQSVGQQTYQGYLQQLNDKVPELYQLALNQYNREGEDLYNQYSLYADRENTEYGRYRDTVSDYNTERGYLTDQYNNERNFDYGQHIDERDYAYQVARDAVADSQWQAQFDEGVRQYDTSLGWDKEKYSMDDKYRYDALAQDQSQFDATMKFSEKELAVQQTQWKAEFDERIRQYDEDYKLKVQQIEEDVRHNKITESQGQQQIDLEKQKLAENKRQADLDYSYKMSSLEAKKVTPTPEPDPEPEDSGFSGKTYSEAVAYMKKNGVSSAAASGIRTRSEFNRWSQKGMFDSYADYLAYQTKYNIEKYGK